jgi:hypothetical protein
MEKVYIISQLIFEEYDRNDHNIVGVFSDSTYALNILSKLEEKLESRLKEVYELLDDVENYTQEHYELYGELRELGSTSYIINEYIINDLNNYL